MYPYPVNITFGPTGYLFMSTYESTLKLMKLFKIQLHNLIQKIGFKLYLPSKANMFCYNGLLFLHSNVSPISFINLRPFQITKLRSKKYVFDYTLVKK